MLESARASLPIGSERCLLGWARVLPLASLLSRLSTPLGGSSGSGSSGVPAGGSGVRAPLASGTGRGSLPVRTGGESASLDGGRANLVGGGELLLLNLLLGLGLRVAVCERLAWFLGPQQPAGRDIQK